VVILIHGIGSSLEDWAFNINALAEKHRVYAIDLVGFGRSDKPEPSYSPEYSSFARFVNDFMVAQRIEHASLVGNSMGGAVSLQFAIQFPEKLEKLVLVNSAGLGKEFSPALRICTLTRIGELLIQPGRKGIARSLKALVYDKTLVTDEQVESQCQLASLPGWQEYFLSTLRNVVSFRGQRSDVIRPIIDNLSSITTPTLIIWGQQDEMIPVAHAQIAKERIPNAELHIFDCCGHVPPKEHPEEFNNLVLQFLAS
jgi:4,5:9,10-diseco-3-hydroxy-5,9,17-trioxoandrosta-1(10),2-diene-4-oate hydrolase